MVKTRHTSAVVLGCGGIRALAQLPLLKYLKEKNVEMDVIIGCGGGAVIGALYASGFSDAEIPALMAQIFARELFNKLDYSMILKIMGLRTEPFVSPPAPYNEKPFLEVLKKIFGDRRLEDLPQKLEIMATDMSTGKECTLTSGLLYECVYASNATYPFFAPIKLQEMWLASGMFTAALPVLQAVQNNYDVVFVVNVIDTTPIATTEMVEYINTFFMRACTNTQARQITLAISLHEGEVVPLNVSFDQSIDLWDVQSLESVYRAGERMVRSKQDQINEAIKLL